MEITAGCRIVLGFCYVQSLSNYACRVGKWDLSHVSSTLIASANVSQALQIGKIMFIDEEENDFDMKTWLLQLLHQYWNGCCIKISCYILREYKDLKDQTRLYLYTTSYKKKKEMLSIFGYYYLFYLYTI